MHCVEKKVLSGGCEDRGILWHFSRIYLSICKGHLTLLLMGLFQTLVLMGGGLKVPPPIFICENTRKSNKIMHCVEKKII